MTHEPDNHHRVLRGYLLGRTPDNEREQLEHALLSDEGLYEELLATEDELVDEYVWGRLSEAERQHFLEYLRALPEYEPKLAFAQALRSHTLTSPSETSGRTERPRPLRESASFQVPGWLFVAASLLITVGSIASLVTISGLQEEVGRTRAELARLQDRQNDLQRQGAGASDSEGLSSPSVRSYLLAPGTLRSGGARQSIAIPRQPELLQFRLDLGSVDYPSYRVVVLDANALPLMSQSQLRARTLEDRILVVFHASSDLFTPGDYYISLMGQPRNGEAEPVARYDLRIATE